MTFETAGNGSMSFGDTMFRAAGDGDVWFGDTTFRTNGNGNVQFQRAMFRADGVGNVIFDETTLTDAIFWGADFGEASFAGAELTRVDLRGANVAGVSVDGATTCGRLYKESQLTTHEWDAIARNYHDFKECSVVTVWSVKLDLCTSESAVPAVSKPRLQTGGSISIAGI